MHGAPPPVRTLIPALLLAPLLLALPLAYGEIITAQDGPSYVTIRVDDGSAVSYLALIGGTAFEPAAPDIKQRSYGFIISDRPAGFFAVVKNVDGGHVITTRTGPDQTAVTWFTGDARPAAKPAAEPEAGPPADAAREPDKEPAGQPAGQRDLLEATVLETKDEAPKPPDRTGRDDATKILEEDLRKLAEQNKNPIRKKAAPEEITIEEYKRQAANKTTGPAAPDDLASLVLLARVEHVQLGGSLTYEVLTGDGVGGQYSIKFDGTPGKGVPGIKLVGVVKDTSGKELNKQEGTTGKDGLWESEPFKPPGQKEKKKYSVEITATYDGDTPITSEIKKFFRTVADTDGVYEARPTASVTHSSTSLPVTGDGNLDTDEIVRAVIAKYKGSDGDLANIVYEGGRFVDRPGSGAAVPLEEGELRERLKGTGHVSDDGRRWDFCLSANVTLDASASTDADDDTLVYKWQFESPSSHLNLVDAAFDRDGPLSHALVNDLLLTDTRLFVFNLVVSDFERDSREELVHVRIGDDPNAAPILCDRP